MPLSPLPASNTKRYFLQVTAGAFVHHIQIRATAVTVDGAALAAIANDFTILLPALGNNVTLDSLEVADVGSDIRNVVPGWTLLTGSGGTPVVDQDVARTFSLRGRSTTGRKVKMLLWGFIEAHQPDFELALADQTAAQSNFQAQVQARPNLFMAIDESKPDWRTNYLEDYNDHFEKLMRP